MELACFLLGSKIVVLRTASTRWAVRFRELREQTEALHNNAESPRAEFAQSITVNKSESLSANFRSSLSFDREFGEKRWVPTTSPPTSRLCRLLLPSTTPHAHSIHWALEGNTYHIASMRVDAQAHGWIKLEKSGDSLMS